MLNFLIRRLILTLPIMLGVALVCFALVHIAPGDPLVSVLPARRIPRTAGANDGALRI